MSSQAGNVVTERGAKVERNGSKPEIGRIVFFLSASSARQNGMYRGRYVSLPSLETFLRESTNASKIALPLTDKKLLKAAWERTFIPNLTSTRR